jgi:hypothetical protein
MTNEQKAMEYDTLIYESDKLQRINSKYKSEYAGNIPPNIQREIDINDSKISAIVSKLENLLR